MEKTGPRNLVETKDQIEYISRYSNSAKNKDQNSNIPRKAGYSKLPNHFKMTNMFGTPVENTWKYVFEAPVRTFFCVWCSDSLAVGKDPKVVV